jgi:DNA-binding NarL/FixJ family response regulator
VRKGDTADVMKQIQVLLVDDEPSIIRGLKMRLGLESDIEVIGEAFDGSAAVEMAGRLAPDVVLMDVSMPVMDGIAATRQLADRAPGTAVVILSMHDDNATIDRARDAGAVAFVAKQRIDEGLLAAIRGAAHRSEEVTLAQADDNNNPDQSSGGRTQW